MAKAKSAQKKDTKVRGPEVPGVDLRIATKRNEAGISQNELARRIGCDPSQISRFERGETFPSVGTLLQLAKGLGTTTDYLLTGVETMRQKTIRRSELPGDWTEIRIRVEDDGIVLIAQ